MKHCRPVRRAACERESAGGFPNVPLQQRATRLAGLLCVRRAQRGWTMGTGEGVMVRICAEAAENVRQ